MIKRLIILFLMIIICSTISMASSKSSLLNEVEELGNECETLWDKLQSYIGDLDPSYLDIREPEIYDLSDCNYDELEEIKEEYENYIDNINYEINKIENSIDYYSDFSFDEDNEEGKTLEEALEEYDYEKKNQNTSKQVTKKEKKETGIGDVLFYFFCVPIIIGLFGGFVAYIGHKFSKK